jgi:hypothetical protein
MPALRNEFSWSRSRDETFRACLRKYWFQYYGSWDGWRADAPEETRAIYVLKQLQTREMWAGSRVHQCIQVAIQNLRRGIPPLEVERAIDLTLQEMRRDFAASRKKYYWSHPKATALFEHEYAVPVRDEEWKATADHVVRCLRSFYASEIWRRLLDLPPGAILETESLSSFEQDGIRVIVVLDLALREDEGIRIWDWKTGRSRSEETRLQLACYALYAMRKWNVPAGAIETFEFNLASNEVIPYRSSSAEIAGALDVIRGSARDMRLLLEGEDPGRNRAVRERFPLTEDLALCARCNFKRLCGRE